MLCRGLVLIAAALLGVSALAAPARPCISIIIDDLGYERAAGARAIALPGPTAYAILPDTPHAVTLAVLAHAQDKDVLLHLPLQAQDPAEPGEPGTLLLDMSQQVFRRTFAAHVDAVPFIVGISTHRGSLLTRHPGHMDWLMDEILARGSLVFIDSRTTARSVALTLAHERGVPSLERDVFLDSDPSVDAIGKEFARLKEIARQQGFAVGIGHPYPATLSFLERMLPTLDADGFELRRISELVRTLDARRLPVSAVSAQ